MGSENKQETTSCNSTFTNPVMDGADPWVIKKDGYYYFCESREGGIHIAKSRKLTEPQNWTRVWQQPAEGWNSSHLWAPELHYIQGKWYVYYTAGEAGPPFIHQRSGVLEGSSQDPQESFEEKGQLYTGDDISNRTNNTWAIDLTPLKLGDQLYGIWSGWKQNRNDDATTQHLYIAKMENPWTISSSRVLISSPEESWERGNEVDFGINEGPEVLRHGDDVFVIYSTRESWLPQYRLGQLRLAGTDADPMNPENWTKTGPVFQGTESVHGVGHASFTTSPDSIEHWIIYHSKKSTEPGWNRDIRMQPFSWNEDGSPDFGTPANTGVPMPVPSGQCDRKMQ
ncbi:family 43 glycosylhydrolase [Halalkalibaculum sp. DA3122]|uniref:glycoside hydrolase family 43 protein n=1 Tax=unclassified Halalkalibaculum TaxID=2964617 RepID=UPI00375502AC